MRDRLIRRLTYHTLAGAVGLAVVACAEAPPPNAEAADPAAALDAALAAAPAATLGDGAMFSKIIDVEVTPAGDILVLDRPANRVFRFGSDGARKGGYGREGRGPDELARPVALALSPDGGVAVLDPPNGRIARAGITPDSMVGEDTVPIPAEAVDLCYAGGRAFFLGAVEEAILHEVDAVGQRLGDFGDLLGDNVLERDLSGHGTLACVDTTAVIAASAVIPVVRAFSPSGDSLWAVELPDFHRTVFVTNDEGWISPTAGPSGLISRVLSARVLSGGLLLVQVETRKELDRTGETATLESRLLDIATGTEVARRSDWPRLYYVGEGVAVAEAEGLEPRLDVFTVAKR